MLWLRSVAAGVAVVPGQVHPASPAGAVALMGAAVAALRSVPAVATATVWGEVDVVVRGQRRSVR